MLVLVPPSTYFKKNGVDFDVPEPAVFYYYTGLKTAWVNSPIAINAGWMVIADKGRYKIIPVTNKNVLADSINSFKKYPLDL